MKVCTFRIRLYYLLNQQSIQCIINWKLMCKHTFGQLFINQFRKVVCIQTMYLAFGGLVFKKIIITNMLFFIMGLPYKLGLVTRSYRHWDTAGRDRSPSNHRSRPQASPWRHFYTTNTRKFENTFCQNINYTDT